MTIPELFAASEKRMREEMEKHAKSGCPSCSKILGLWFSAPREEKR